MRGFRLTPDAQSDLLDIRRFTVILNRAYKAAKKSRLENTKLAYQALLVLRDHYVPMRREGGDDKQKACKAALGEPGLQESPSFTFDDPH